MQNISSKYKKIISVINSNNKYSSENGHISTIAVTKNQKPHIIREALDSGIRIFGENRVQEAEQKFLGLKKTFNDLELHMIGPMQTNKVKKALGLFDYFHTLDREKLAKEFFKCLQMEKSNKFFFIQINTGLEEQKAGIFPAQANEFIKYCVKDLKLNVLGLMCIPPIDEDPKDHFLLLKKISIENNLKNLSMGMSNDYEIALSCGATHVRIGSYFFGERN